MKGARRMIDASRRRRFSHPARSLALLAMTCAWCVLAYAWSASAARTAREHNSYVATARTASSRPARSTLTPHANTVVTLPPRDGIATPRANLGQPERSALGRALFFDENLSEPAGTSCASCHDPARGFASGRRSRTGTAHGSRPLHVARRNTPSLLYLKFVPKFHFRWEEDAALPDAVGGYFWDGRSDSLAELVRQPLLDADEMNDGDAATAVAKLRQSSEGAALQSAFGFDWDDSEAVLRGFGQALEAFMTSDAFAPFSSKYDAYIRGQRALSPLEKQGLALFRDASKGGCDVCHKMNDASPDPRRSLFTDFSYDALAVPRNRKLPGNRDRTHFDLGLCTHPERHFPMSPELWCGSFRTPSLRNVALRTSFMHNGAFSQLRDVVSFYATRGTMPKRWYSGGAPFDDLPTLYQPRVQKDRAPYDRKLGERPRLDDHEVDASVAFLTTLSDAVSP
jgi:cytochrome c peroxidase